MNIMGEDTTLHPYKSEPEDISKWLSLSSAQLCSVCRNFNTTNIYFVFLRKFTIKMSELSVFYAKVFISEKNMCINFIINFTHKNKYWNGNWIILFRLFRIDKLLLYSSCKRALMGDVMVNSGLIFIHFTSLYSNFMFWLNELNILWRIWLMNILWFGEYSDLT